MMALVHPLGFGSCRFEHGQNLLQSRDAKEENDSTTTRPCAAPTLPPGFPMFLDSELAWSTSEISGGMEYTYHLTQEDRAEIDNALQSFKGLYRPCSILRPI